MHRQRPSERPLIGARTVLEPILYKRDSFFLAKPKRFDSVHSHATTMEFLFWPLAMAIASTLGALYAFWASFVGRVIDATSLQHRQRWRKSLRFLRLKHLAHAGGMTALGNYQNQNDNCSTKREKKYILQLWIAYTITWRKDLEGHRTHESSHVEFPATNLGHRDLSPMRSWAWHEFVAGRMSKLFN